MSRQEIIDRLFNPPQLEIKSPEHRQQLEREYISRLEDFIFRQHNFLELGDLDDVFLVSTIIENRKVAA